MIASWRFPAGVAIFGVGFAAPLAIPLLVASEMPAPWKTAISGVLAVGVPEVMMLLAAAVMGKEGFAELKRRAGRIFARHGPPQQVSRARYRVGLVMFVVPLLLGFFPPTQGIASGLRQQLLNLAFGLMLFFLARIQGSMYFLNNVAEESIVLRARKSIRTNALFFLPLFIGVAAAIYLEEYAPDNWVSRAIRTNIANLAGLDAQFLCHTFRQ